MERHRLRVTDWRAMAELLARSLRMAHPPGMYGGCEACDVLRQARDAGLFDRGDQ